MRLALAPDRWLALLILTCALCSTGCTLIGLGVGAAVHHGERNVSAEKLRSYPPDVGVEPADLHVDVRLRPGATADGKSRLTGSYHSVSSAGLVVVTDRRQRRIPLQDVQRVDVRWGSCWSTGLLIGFAVDVGLALVVGVLAASKVHAFGW